MKKTTFFIMNLIVAILALGCSHTIDIKYVGKYDPAVDFKNISSYQWEDIVGALNDPDGTWNPSNLDAVSELKQLIDRELSKSGMHAVKENPDVKIFVAVVVDMDNQELLSDHKKDIAELYTLPKGALVITMIDTKNNKVIWIGEAESQVQNNQDPDLVKKRLDTAVTGMFKNFPK